MTLRHFGRALAAASGAALLCASLAAPALATPDSDTATANGASTSATDADSTPITVTASRTDSNGETVYAGDVITVTFTYTNNTDDALTVFPVASNLSGVLTTGAPNCRWHNLAAHTTKQCTTATHTVTTDDVATGNFTPTSTWAATRDREGKNVIAGDITASLAPISVADGTRPPEPDPLETPHDYAIGEKVRLASPGDSGFTCHRIPALTTTTNGWILAAWDGRPDNCQDAPQANSIIYRISKDGGKSWTPVKTAIAGTPGANKVGYSDPSFVVDRTTGTIFLFSAHAGRLIQQYAVANTGTTSLMAVSVYSDDHGATWKPGAPTEGSADENKVVELSDGRLLLNSRTQGTAGQRLEAISYDGGQTWGPFRHNWDLTDPRNNASIVRAYPDAPEGSARARVLLFSNADSASARANGTVRVSYDDGFTWSDGKVFESGEMAYSTLHPLADGTWGLLYESGGYKNIEFMRMDASYLGLTDPGEGPAPTPQPSPDPAPATEPAHWVNTGNGWKWQLEDSTFATSRTLTIGEATYRFDANGMMVTGWDNQDGAWSYYNAYGARVSGWLMSGGSWYYIDPATGIMNTGWVQVDGRWYLLSSSGAMLTGWQQLGATWYYLGPSGAMLTGWQQIGRTWYYFASDGHMVTGWQTIDGRWYLFAPSGAWI